MIPDRPVASIKCVKVVLPWTNSLLGGETGEEKKPGNEESFGEAGGDGGHGGGLCVHETDIGLPGIVDEKEIESTFVCS